VRVPPSGAGLGGFFEEQHLRNAKYKFLPNNMVSCQVIVPINSSFQAHQLSYFLLQTSPVPLFACMPQKTKLQVFVWQRARFPQRRHKPRIIIWRNGAQLSAGYAYSK